MVGWNQPAVVHRGQDLAPRARAAWRSDSRPGRWRKPFGQSVERQARLVLAWAEHVAGRGGAQRG